jgi:hypothetical protein
MILLAHISKKICPVTEKKRGQENVKGKKI